MLEMSLFPLNTVLFPGMPINLHIFEERYKLMIQRCLEASLTFGIVLIEEGSEALGPLARPHRVGCTAQITQVEKLSMGRMNIMAMGKQRFLISALDTAEPYLRAQVDLYPLANPEPAALQAEDRRLRHWMGRYLAMLEAAGQTSIALDQMPQDSLTFGYLAASLLQVPARQKQPLLAADSALSFLHDLGMLYRREVALLNALLEKPGQSRRIDNHQLN
jgi:Lon protease-like protein